MTLPIRDERDTGALGRPDRIHIVGRVINQVALVGAVGVHHVYLSVPVPLGLERQARAVGRPDRHPVPGRVISEVTLVGAIGVHHVYL